MTITPLTIYLWQIADQVHTSAGIACIMFTMGFTVAAIYFIVMRSESYAPDDADAKQAIKTSRVTMTVATLALTFSITTYVFVPSSKTVAMMVVIPEITHSRVIQQDLPDTYNAAVDALKTAITKPADGK